MFVATNMDNLIRYCFTSHGKIFVSDGDVTIAGGELQHLGRCVAFMGFEQTILCCSACSVFPVSPEGPLRLFSMHRTS